MATCEIVSTRQTILLKIPNFSTITDGKIEKVKTTLMYNGRDGEQHVDCECTFSFTTVLLMTCKLVVEADFVQCARVYQLKFSILNNNNESYITKSDILFIPSTERLQIYSDWVILNFGKIDFQVAKENDLLTEDTLRVVGEIHNCGEDYISMTWCLDKPRENYELLRRPRFSDVKLVSCGGREIRAHKAILAAHSPVWSAMFEHPMKERSESTILMEYVEYEVLRAMLVFIYTGACNGLEDLASDVLPLAEGYFLANLKLKCEEVMAMKLDVKNCAQMLIIADLYNCESLKRLAFVMAVEKEYYVSRTPEYSDMKKSHPHLLLNIHSALQRLGQPSHDPELCDAGVPHTLLIHLRST